VIDRVARDQLALLLRRLITGRISTDDFDNNRPDRSPDPGVVAVSEAAWTNLYSDFWPVHLSRQKLSGATRSHVSRWIVFLYSDTEYEWPDPPHLFKRVISMFFPGPSARRVWEAQGDIESWPFLRPEDYKNALTSPRLLHGPVEHV
jgi:hypothetical protein